ncbi:MAG: hypothetical protein KDE47_11210 [Caldilineaceae bacterium]|nr:hypothetical protein [Caldilineaceae bacterium]
MSVISSLERANFVDKWNVIASKAHKMAIEKGFHEEGDALIEELIELDVQEFETGNIDGGRAKFVVQLIMVKELALISGEVDEAIEAVRAGNETSKKIPHLAVTEELADVVIRIMDTAAKRGLPLAEAILDKIEFNAGREVKHGKRF